MKRWALLVYGCLAYLLFVATFAYGVAFFGNLFFARTIDAAAGIPMGASLVVNSGLLLLFALQHSGMARPTFKWWWADKVPPRAVRSTYVLMSSVTLILLMTMSHLVFAVGMTAYTLIAIRLEERELMRRLPYYRQYRRKVPMLIPSLRKRLVGSVDT